MFGIIAVTSVLEFIIFMPISFTILRFVLPANLALLLSIVLCLIALFACWLCKLRIKVYVYRITSVIVAISVAFITAQVSLVTILLVALCIFVFIRVKSNMESGRDIASQIAMVAIILNIPLAIINVYTISSVSPAYSNATIFISTISTVILLILKQVDDSRTFGQNNMDISKTQRKNNRIFAVVLLVVLLVISSIGHVSKIYGLIINIFVKFFKLLTAKSSEETTNFQGQMQDVFGIEEASDPSTLDMIIQALLYVVSVIIIVVLVGLVIYNISKLIIKLIRRIISWLKNGEQVVLPLYEDGHIDEKQSLYNRNLRNMAIRLRDMAVSLLEREIPYNKLPNDIAKVRRLFKNYKGKAKQEGVKICSASTAEEICNEVSYKAPETKQFNDLISKCYDAARYGEVVPSPQELVQLEDKLLK